MFRILIVEDQSAVREVLKEMIQSQDRPVSIQEAGSLAETRKFMEAEHWDCMITDLHLTDGDSLGLIRDLRTQGNNTPVILVSGFISNERRNEAAALGIEHICPKPFYPETILRCMHELLPEPAAASARKSLPKKESSSTLIPELFTLDRQLSLLHRMLTEVPQHKDVGDICAHSLKLAKQMVRAERGFIALFDRSKKQLVMIAHDSEDGRSVHDLPHLCPLQDTPFSPLLNGDVKVISEFSSRKRHHCWQGIRSNHFLAFPLLLEGSPMGVLCLMDNPGKHDLSVQEFNMINLLLTQLDTLLDNRAVHAALSASMNDTLIALVRSLEARDRYTKDHSTRVSKMSVLFATELGLDQGTIDKIRTGGLLHDIGKSGIPDAVLLKKGRFTDQEFSIMKAHPGIGDSILKHMDTLTEERLMVRHHHERWDGNGYPDKLKAEEIPLTARIVCVADAIDAMTTHRCYRTAQPLSFCVEQLKLNRAIQFDPDVVEAAVDAIEQGAIETQASASNVVTLEPIPANV